MTRICLAPAQPKTSCLWILGPGNAMSGSCLGSPSWPGVPRGQSLAREDRRPHHVHVVLVFRRARHCHLLATRHTVKFSCSCLGQRPEDFPTEFFSIVGRFFVPSHERTRRTRGAVSTVTPLSPRPCDRGRLPPLSRPDERVSPVTFLARST